MAPLFASADIATLVAAYPPPLPSRGSPSLVRTYSKNNLLRSQHVLKKFQRLLDTSTDRIRLEDLSLRLGIERADWVIDCYNGTVFLSRDGRSVVPNQELDSLLRDLSDRVTRGFVNQDAFLREVRLSDQSGPLLSSSAKLAGVYSFQINSSNWIVAKVFEADLRDRMFKEISQRGSDKVNLSTSFPDIQSAIIERTIAQLQQQHEQVNGSLEKEGDHVFFVPSAYASLQEERKRTERADMVEKHVKILADDGFCRVDRQSISQDGQKLNLEQWSAEICDKSRAEHPDSKIVSLPNSSQGYIVLAIEGKVAEALKTIEESVEKLFTDRERPFDKPFDQDEIKHLVSLSPLTASLWEAMLQQPTYFKATEAAYNKAKDHALAGEAAAFADLFRDRIAAPLHLYSLGVSEANDSTLSEHLDAYLLEHFTRDIIPQAITAAREQSLLRHKPRSRDVEKLLQQTTKESRTLSDLQTACSRFQKRQKIDQPTPAQLKAIKQSTLEGKVKAMQKMSRGSDALQNLVWILLAGKLEGLFMSSGKDTSRMIKLFERVGDEETTGRLVKWRDALKAAGGTVEGGEMAEMKELARRSLAETPVET